MDRCASIFINMYLCSTAEGHGNRLSNVLFCQVTQNSRSATAERYDALDDLGYEIKNISGTMSPSVEKCRVLLFE